MYSFLLNEDVMLTARSIWRAADMKKASVCAAARKILRD
jgi:hypothetical protein